MHSFSRWACFLGATSVFAAVSTSAFGGPQLQAPEDPFQAMGGTESEIRSQLGGGLVDKKIVIQNRYFKKQFRNEIRIGGGMQLAGDQFVNVQEVNAGYRFYFTEWLGLGLSFRQRFRQLSGDYQRLATEASYAPEVVAPRYSYGVDATFVPFYAKVSLFDRQITRLEIYVDSGAHRYHTEKAVRWSAHSAAGVRVIWSKLLSTALEFNHDLFVEDRIGGRTLRSLLSGALHVSIWL